MTAHQKGFPRRTGPVVIGDDGSPTAERAPAEAVATLSQTLLGSTERSVLDSVPCPVLVVREDGAHETSDREEVS